MWTRTLLLSAFVASALAFRIAEKPKESKLMVSNSSSSHDVNARIAQLEHVVTGLQSIYAAQSKSPAGPSKFGEILKPFLGEMHSVLQEVKTDKNLTVAQKEEKLSHAEASVQGLKKDMAKLTADLHTEGEDEKNSLLMGVLMSKKNRPESEQLEVLKSDDFKNLECVKYVLAHRDPKQNLVEQIAAYLDAKAPAKKPASSPTKLSLQSMTQQIVQALESQLQKIEQHVTDQEQLHKKIDMELTGKVKENEKALAALKGKDKNLANQTMDANKTKTARKIKLIRRMEKKEDREYLKQHAIMVRDVSTMKKAIASVKKGDMKALEEAQKALMHSMEAMKSGTGDFLHFLQMSEWRDSRSEECPFCKAQCLEKCHNDGQTFMSCMQTCANVGN